MPRKRRFGAGSGRKRKKGTKDAKLAAARDANAKRMRVQAEGKSAQEKEKGKSRACGDLSSKPGHESHPRREKRKTARSLCHRAGRFSRRQVLSCRGWGTGTGRGL